MPTKKREWYPYASYHITARGNHRNDIFKDKEDFIYYLTLIKEAVEYYIYDKYEIISYCLMDNHVHILIKTGERHLGQFIGKINSKYAKYYNKKYNYIGHLFQDRYFSELIESDAQMLETSKYIHLNPVRAKMVEKPEDYEWSSYPMYIGNKKENLICSSYLLSYFNSENRELYKKYVEAVI
ncbi:transposase [Clostridium magnum]|uniref:Transposase IS200 like protein n=1 Tax=Clostridium magnum DSM 2767 TaxID=1121326 RepID=A0A161WPS4_9CLOT|nr:transposase [Clostridium magnum]KZL88578.1 transposase IS200 like protein [Clostridium magnum DSM 2767]SHI83320.1 REP element-mobilizing transposase RayT [Clostridium magnum DSM 2767]